MSPKTTLLLLAYACCLPTGPARAEDLSTGTGFLVSASGDVMTANHVVADCDKLIFRLHGSTFAARVVDSDAQNDLAIIRSSAPIPTVVPLQFSSVKPDLGTQVFVFGFPLAGIATTDLQLTIGNVSALRGLGNDGRYYQITAPSQPGNSGGPVLDETGSIVGMLTATINKATQLVETGSIPENMNYAVKFIALESFLESLQIAPARGSPAPKTMPQVVSAARAATVLILCERATSPTDAAREATGGGVVSPAKNPQVVLSTSLGEITIELFPQRAPRSVENFLAYVRDDHYVGTIFHRVISGFMIQGGGFTPDLTLKPTRAAVPNEATNGLSNVRGTVALARTNDPHSGASQFFINLVDNQRLDHVSTENAYTWGYAVFGRVTGGMDVVDRIAAVRTTAKGPLPKDVPSVPIVVSSARVY